MMNAENIILAYYSLMLLSIESGPNATKLRLPAMILGTQLTNRMSTDRFSGAVFHPTRPWLMAYALWDDGVQRKVYSIELDGTGETSVIDPLIADDIDTFQVVNNAGVSKRIYQD